jgi:hypothetical protein
VKRSVSVTDFLSSPVDHVIRGFVAFSQIAECDQSSTSATVIASIGGVSGEPRSREELVLS